MIQPNTVRLERVVQWYRSGWQVFRSNIAAWIPLVLTFFAIIFVLQLFPVIGGLVAALITPALVGGVLVAAREALAGRKVMVGQLFTAFQDGQKRTPMLILGAIQIGLVLLLSLLYVALIGSAVGIAVTNPTPDTTSMTGGALIITILATFSFLLAVFAVQAYAIPLVMFSTSEPFAAIKASLLAVFRNLGPMLLFLAIYFMLSLLAVIPLLLGFLILAPVMAGALYQSFTEIFLQTAPSPLPFEA